MSHRLLVKDSRCERELLLIDTIVVGRDPRCDISDADAQLSRRHAEFSVSEDGVVVRDLNSRNGMLVNGKRMLEAVLRPGDVVQVASIAVTFVTATAQPEAVSMPAAASSAERRPAGPPLKTRRGAEGQPVLPFRVQPEDDDRTGLMSPDQVAAAAIASLAERSAGAGKREQTATEADAQRGTAAAPMEPATVVSAPEAAPAPIPAPDPAWPPPVVSPAAATTAEEQPVPSGAPLVATPPAPITRVAEPGWMASLTWHVATLAIVAFLVGALSALPWRVGPLGGVVLTGAMILLVPLVALLAVLALGVLVAARIRAATLVALSELASQVRRAGDGQIERVADPLGTKTSNDLAEAINEILLRARALQKRGE